MKILVTGGSGFIGRALVPALIKEDHNVTILDIKMPDFPGRVHYFMCDILQTMDDIFLKVKPEVVIHLAASYSAGDLNSFNVNVRGTNKIIDACLNFGVKKIIFASSCKVYGDNFELQTTEDTPVSPDTVYSFTKSVAESLVRASGLDYIILRLFNVTGAGCTTQKYLLPLAFAATVNEPLVITASWDSVCDYVHVDDVADAFVKALDKGNNETINIGTGIPTKLRHVINMISDIKGSMVPIEYSPQGKEIIYTADTSKAQNLLGWRPTKNIGDMVKDAVEWSKR
jgi:UDP-glucose 4-epimerase